MSPLVLSRTMDVSHFTAKERRESRKQLLKKIDSYNKHAKEARKAKRPSFPITSPSKVGERGILGSLMLATNFCQLSQAAPPLFRQSLSFLDSTNSR